MTLAEAIRAGAALLGRAGVADARADARILLRAAAGLDGVALYRDPDAALSEAAETRFRYFLSRRAAREPVSRILGRREFWGFDLAIGPAVLDPRPDTETVVSAVLEHLAPRRHEPWRILDLGAGSGAIVCALLSELPRARGWAVDRSEAACRIARLNLGARGLSARGLVVCGDWANALAAGVFDVVVSNPPYIETATVAELDPEVRDYDPILALDGGLDGLNAYRILAAESKCLLAPSGLAAFEVGPGQAASVSSMLAVAGLEGLGVRRDLSGVDRVVIGLRV